MVYVVAKTQVDYIGCNILISFTSDSKDIVINDILLILQYF